MDFTKDFINRARNTIHKQSIPPVYNPEEWKGKKFNCYAYALQMNMHIESMKLGIGFTTGILYGREKYTVQFVLEQFLIDCENLKLNCTQIQIDDEIDENEYKVALYVWENFSYHLKRQDIDGNWSEKRGWLEPISKVKKEDLGDEEDFMLIGFFKISKKKE